MCLVAVKLIQRHRYKVLEREVCDFSTSFSTST
jgi:hypothetical protein